MQSKTILIAVLGLLCAGIFGWVLFGGTDTQSLAQWDQQDEVEMTDDELAAEMAAAGDADEPGRSEFEGDGGTVGEDGELRPMVKVVGRVVDKQGGAVVGAKVALTASSRSRRRGRNRNRVEKEVVTGSDGRFAFSGKGFTSMWVSLRVSHDEFADASSFKTFQAKDGQMDMGDIEVVVGGTIIGSITDMQGNVVVDAEARLSSSGRGRGGWGRGGWGRGSQPTVKADTNGVFRIEHVPPGSYRITASAPRRQRATEGPITVVDAQEERLDPIQLGPGFVLTGVVYQPDGKPLKGAEVDLSGRSRERGRRTNKDGEFHFDHLPAGNYNVQVEADGYLRNKEIRDLDVTKAQPLAITMKPGLTIEGIVTDAVTGEPVLSYGARVRRLASLPDPEAERRRAQQSALREEIRALRDLGDKRSASQSKALEDLMARAREAGISRGRGGFDGGRGRGGDRGRGDRGRGGDRGPGGDRGRGGERGRGGDRGRRGGDRGRGRSFGRGDWFRRNENLPGDTGKVEAHAEGKFRFPGLEEGIYVVDIGSPEHQKLRSQKIELRAGQTVPPLALAVQRGLRITGKVLSRSGTPLGNAEVELRLVLEDTRDDLNRDTGNQDRGRGRGFERFFRSSNGLRTTGILETRAKADGSFVISNAPAGRYLLRAEAKEHARLETEPFELKADMAQKDLTLGALGTIQGRVEGIPVGQTGEVRVIAFKAPFTRQEAKVAENGVYEIGGLEPGDYIVKAFQGDARRSLFREMFRAMSSENNEPKFDVQVKEGGLHRFNTTLTVDVTGTVIGRVLVNGESATGYRVSLRKIDDGSSEQRSPWSRFGRGSSGTVDQNGNYKIENVEPAEYNLVVYASGGRRGFGSEISRSRVFVGPEQTVTAPLVTVDYGALSGKIELPAEETKEKTNSSTTGNSRPTRSSGRVSLYKDVTTIPDPDSPGGRDVMRFSARVRGDSFEFKELPTGNYLIQLRMTGREAVTKTVYVGAGAKEVVAMVAGKVRQTKPTTKR